LKPLDHAEVLRCLGDLLQLEWVKAAVPVSDQMPDTRRPGPADLQTLRKMIDGGHISDIVAWADALAKREPELRNYASRVRAATQQLDFRTLAELADMKRVGEDGPECPS
jgi:hypothetical protein